MERRVPAGHLHCGHGVSGIRKVDAGERNPLSCARAYRAVDEPGARATDRGHRPGRTGHPDRSVPNRPRAKVESGDLPGLFTFMRGTLRDAAGIRRAGTRTDASPSTSRAAVASRVRATAVRPWIYPRMCGTCEECKGRRYNRETLEVTYRGRVHRADAGLDRRPDLPLRRKLSRGLRSGFGRSRLGLGYIRLGQSATTLSGGEAQHVKLAAARRGTGRITPSTSRRTGLHFRGHPQRLRSMS